MFLDLLNGLIRTSESLGWFGLNCFNLNSFGVKVSRFSLVQLVFKNLTWFLCETILRLEIPNCCWWLTPTTFLLTPCVSWIMYEKTKNKSCRKKLRITCIKHIPRKPLNTLLWMCKCHDYQSPHWIISETSNHSAIPQATHLPWDFLVSKLRVALLVNKYLNRGLKP